jgi:hypothetical protein
VIPGTALGIGRQPGWRWSGPRRRRRQPPTGRCARAGRTTRTSRELPTSTTARWRCAATPTPGDPPGTLAGAPQHRTSGCHRVRHLVALLADRRLPAALAGVIGLVGVGFSRVGFHHPQPSQAVSWLYALQATVSLEGKARQLSGQLTLPGERLRVACGSPGRCCSAWRCCRSAAGSNAEPRHVALQDPCPVRRDRPPS